MRVIRVGIFVAMFSCSSALAGEFPCPPKVAPNGLDFSLPCIPHPDEHEALKERVFFDSRSVELTTAARKILDRQAAYLLANQNLKIELVGFADGREAPSSIEKLELGGNRAAAVRAYLVDKGIDPLRISALGRGNMPVLAKNADDMTLALMRFVYAKEQTK